MSETSDKIVPTVSLSIVITSVIMTFNQYLRKMSAYFTSEYISN